MRLASLRLASWIIAFLESMFFDHWQSSMFEGSVVTSYFSEILRVVSSKLSLLIPSGTSMISKHSHLEYWLFPQHCLCNATTHSCNLLFTFLETDTSDLTFLKLLRSTLSSLLTLLIPVNRTVVYENRVLLPMVRDEGHVNNLILTFCLGSDEACTELIRN